MNEAEKIDLKVRTMGYMYRYHHRPLPIAIQADLQVGYDMLAEDPLNEERLWNSIHLDILYHHHGYNSRKGSMDWDESLEHCLQKGLVSLTDVFDTIAANDDFDVHNTRIEQLYARMSRAERKRSWATMQRCRMRLKAAQAREYLGDVAEELQLSAQEFATNVFYMSVVTFGLPALLPVGLAYIATPRPVRNYIHTRFNNLFERE